MSWQILNVTKNEISEATRLYQKKARFFVDENLGKQTSQFIKSRGWNVKDVFDVGLTGHPDEKVMAYAFRDQRILLSQDKDFLNDRIFPFHKNPGVIILPGGSGNQYVLVRALMDVLVLVGPFAEFYRGAKMEVSENQIFSVRRRDEFNKLKTTKYKYGGQGPAYIWID